MSVRHSYDIWMMLLYCALYTALQSLVRCMHLVLTDCTQIWHMHTILKYLWGAQRMSIFQISNNLICGGGKKKKSVRPAWVLPKSFLTYPYMMLKCSLRLVFLQHARRKNVQKYFYRVVNNFKVSCRSHSCPAQTYPLLPADSPIFTL